MGAALNAIFSADGKRRYTLHRDLGRQGPTVLMIGVNPSIATDDRNDATIRKDIGFGERHGWGRLMKGNLFALISTDIRGLRQLETGADAQNDAYLLQMMQEANLTIACWGPPEKVPPKLRNRWRHVVAMAKAHEVALHCLGTTSGGHQRHPLMTPYSTPLTLWTPPA